MKKILITLNIFFAIAFYTYGQNEKSINNNGMPNRISMNVTVPKQTQGATFGEKINAGIHASGGAYIIFPNRQAFLITQDKITEMSNAEVAKVNAGLHAAGSAVAQGASLVGGALPGGAIISAAVSKVDNNRPIWDIKNTTESFSLPGNLSDGDYILTVVIEKATSGLKDTLKTQVRLMLRVENKTYKVVSANI